MEVIIGTAGHIDHGKTALVKALTGTDADRLPEEKLRGITVDLGFAEMIMGEVHFGFVDVPGHERFVKNMLAGASGIDIVLLVIAADEGVMPQTREHFDICQLLGLKAGAVVLTKSDLVDKETMELARLEVAELVAGSFLENAPVISVSSQTGDGIDGLKNEILRIANDLPVRSDQLVSRLPIDRSFSIKGFGAVVTGTLASGSIKEGAEMQLFPSGTKVRVRGLQTHGNEVKSASAGGRIAVNLGGIDHAKVTRGMILAEPNVLRTTQIIDTEIEVLPTAPKPLRSRQRVRIHIGTIEALARVQILNDKGEISAGEKDLAQIRLETPIVAIPGERFILRSYSPQTTIGGGEVIDPFAAKHRKRELNQFCQHLSALRAASGDLPATVRLILDQATLQGLSFSDLQARTARTKDALLSAIDYNIRSKLIIDANGCYLPAEDFEELMGWVELKINDFHTAEPLAKGISRETLRDIFSRHLPSEVFQTLLTSLESANKVVLENDTVRLTSYKTKLNSVETEFKDKIFAIYKNAGLKTPKLDDALTEAIAGGGFTRQNARKYFQLFLDSGEIVKVTEEFYFERSAINELLDRLRQFAAASGDRLMDVPKFKEIAGVSRKYAIPLIEYFDRERVTARVGDKRKIL